MAPPSVLVLGAGELGSAMLNGLAIHPERKRVRIAVLLRGSTIRSSDPSKRKQIADFKASNIDIVEGDNLDASIDQLSSIFSSFHTIINCFGMTAPPGTQTKIANAILKSSCARYFPWQFGVDYDIIGRNSAQDLFTEQLDVRDLLRSQTETKWVIVSTGIFTSFIFEPAFGVVNAPRDSVTAIGGWENRITATTPEDIGKVTAEIALNEPEIDGVVFIAGDTVSMNDVADIVDRVLGRKVARVEKTVAQLKEELREDPQNGGMKYRVVFGEGIGMQHFSWTFRCEHC